MPRLPRRAVVWAAAAIVALNGFVPAIWVLLTSLKSESELMRLPITVLPAAPTLGNYVRVFVDQPILLFLWNSVMVATLSTLLCIVVSALAAYALVRLRVPAPGVILAVLMGIAMFPLISLVVPLFQTMRGLGLLNTWPALVLPYLGTLKLIRVAFPAFNDGRAFTIARRLRMAGFTGHLRAVGPVIADQYAMARRVGFDDVEIPDDLATRQPQAQWLARADWQAHDYLARLKA